MLSRSIFITALSLLALPACAGSPDSNANLGDDEGALSLFASKPDIVARPLRSTALDGVEVMAVNDSHAFIAKRAGTYPKETTEILRLAHDSTTPEPFAKLAADVWSAIADHDAVYVTSRSGVAKISAGVEPQAIEAPFRGFTLAWNDGKILLGGSDGLAELTPGGSARVLVGSAELARVAEVGRRSVTGATISAMAARGGAVYFAAQQTVNSASASGVVVAKVEAGKVTQLFDGGRGDLLKGIALTREHVWLSRGTTNGDRSGTAELVRFDLDGGGSTRILADSDALVSVGERVFFARNTTIASMSEPKTLEENAPFTGGRGMFATPNGRVIYGTQRERSVRIDR